MMQPVVIRFPEEDKRLLELEAKKEAVSLAEIVRKSIKTYLKQKPRQESGAEVLLRWATRANKYRSHFKDKDVSTNYKKYLYGPKSPKFGYLWKDKK